MHPLIVIPARFGSSRIPGKPLSTIAGEPLVISVYRNALSLGIGATIVVATDDRRIEEAVSKVGGCCEMTSSAHRSGTERVAEVARMPAYAAADPILNIQVDQLFLPQRAAIGALEQLERGFSIGTAATPLPTEHEANRNRVKVAVDANGRAVGFSRDMPAPATGTDRTASVRVHLGVYAYTRDALLRWLALPPIAAEYDQGLEQLRPFSHGIPIGVAPVDEPVEPGIDTIDDLTHARKLTAPNRTDS